MRRLEVVTSIAAVLLVAACAGSPRYAPVQRPVTGRPQPQGVLRDAGRQSSWRHLSGVCGRPLSVDRGDAPRAGAPCTPILLVPVTASRSRAGRPHSVYSRRPCWC